MASIQLRGDSYRVIFRFRGKQRFVTLGRVPVAEAEAKAAQVGYLLMRLDQGLIELPADRDVVDFVLRDGKPAALGAVNPPTPARAVTLADLRDRYLATRGEALEARTLDTARLHFKHLCAILGHGYPIRELTLADLQAYVDRRGKQKTRAGTRLSPVTVRKEVVTLRTAWNWGERMGLVSGRYPYAGLSYPKTEELPPFQNRTQIERQAAGATPAQRKALWDALYLETPEIDEALEIIRRDALHPWIHPMACTAAYTGARRSELIRMRVSDIDFEANVVVVREKKRVKGRHTTRRVPLASALAGVLRAYLVGHPGGHSLFCHRGEVARSKKRSRTTGHRGESSRATSLKGRLATVTQREAPAPSPLTESEAHKHLKSALRGSRWSVIKGWHCWRHSFVSACASKGIDQRLVQEWAGHMDETMSRRYAHLYPSVQQTALDSVFG